MVALLDTAIRTSARDLERALATRYPVVLVFEDTDSAPCRTLVPFLEELAREHVDRVRVIRVTADSLDERTALRYGITQLPTLLFRRHGMEVARIVGAPCPEVLTDHVRYLVGDGPRPLRAEGPSVPLRTTTAAPGAPTGPAPGVPIDAGESTFQELVLQSPLPVLVDFWAVWCAPCRAIAPEIEELARTYAGRLRVVKVNTDCAPGVASRYGVLGIPNLMLFREGHPVFRVTGAVAKSALQQAIDAALSLP